MTGIRTLDSFAGRDVALRAGAFASSSRQRQDGAGEVDQRRDPGGPRDREGPVRARHLEAETTDVKKETA